MPSPEGGFFGTFKTPATLLLIVLVTILAFVMLATLLSSVTEGGGPGKNGLTCYYCNGSPGSKCDNMGNNSEIDTANCPLTSYCGYKCTRQRRVSRGCMSELQYANCTTNCNICNHDFCNKAPNPCSRVLDSFFEAPSRTPQSDEAELLEEDYPSSIRRPAESSSRRPAETAAWITLNP